MVRAKAPCLAVTAAAYAFLQSSTGLGWVILSAALPCLSFKSGRALLMLAFCYRQMLVEDRARLRYTKDQEC